MSDYYTKPESDARFAPIEHTHNIEDLSGTGMAASLVLMPSSVSSFFGDAYALDDGLLDIKSKFEEMNGGFAAVDHTHPDYAAANHVHYGYADAAHSHTPEDIGAATTDHSHDYAATTHTHAQADVTGLAAALSTKANVSAMSAKADLVDGKVPTSQLPSFVDDVEEYAALANFPTAAESGKIYVAQDTNKTYRWSGSAYVEIAQGVALGETSATAYRGDRGKTAYDHSQNATVHVTEAQKTAWDGKAAGNHVHSYNALTDKPTIPTIPASLPANGGNADTVDNMHASDFAAAVHSHMGYSGNSASTYKLVYVSTTGNDNNVGTQAAPMATIREAIRKHAEMYKYLDIRLLDGTYNEDLGAIGVDVTNMSIRSASENKDAVIINTKTQLDLNSGHVRLYNMTINVTETGVRGISVNAGTLYAYSIRVNVPTASTTSCINVYNGATAFLMHCVLNSGTATNSGAAVYGNQAMQIKAINCTSERTVAGGFHAHNGTDIIYTNTINATTKTKETYFGKCTLRS